MRTAPEPVILIGPMKAGKTTVGKRLAQRLDWAFYSLDWMESKYVEPAGFDASEAARLRNDAELGWYHYRRGFFDVAVVQFLSDHTQGVLELGGGHPILPDAEKQRRVDRALQPRRRVVLLMPLPDKEKSLAILNRRQKPENRRPDLNELFLADDRFHRLAKLTLFTDGKSPAQTCQQIIDAFLLG